MLHRHPWQIGIGRRITSEALVLMQNKRADGDTAAAAVAKRADERHVGSSGHEDVFPSAGVVVARGGAENTVEEPLDNPGIAADGRAAIAIPPPTLVLKVEDSACWNYADAKWIVAAAASLRVVLPYHGVLACLGRSQWSLAGSLPLSGK
jgi:hypothetical protein